MPPSQKVHSMYLCSRCLGITVDSNKLEHGCRFFYAGCPSFFGLGLKDGHVPAFSLLLFPKRSMTFIVDAWTLKGWLYQHFPAQIRTTAVPEKGTWAGLT